jgi:polyisoprenoid-binding protein YceI
MSDQVGNAVAARRASGRRSVALDVAGDGLMLRGHFSDWESGLSMGPDLDKVGVRLAVDATSADDGEPLFSFHSRAVEATGPGTFLARGTFSRSDFTKPVEMTVETPPGHTALFVLSFAADKNDFGEAWADLVENVIPFSAQDDNAPVRQAHAWLTTPVLAAA